MIIKPSNLQPRAPSCHPIPLQSKFIPFRVTTSIVVTEAANRKPRAGCLFLLTDSGERVRERERGREGRERERESGTSAFSLYDVTDRCQPYTGKSNVSESMSQAICSHHISFVELVCNHIRLQMRWSKVVRFGEQIWQAILVCYSCTTSS